MKVRFHPLAERELVAAALYLNQEAGLGADFLDEFADFSQNRKDWGCRK
jgi:hypothetical protein